MISDQDKDRILAQKNEEYRALRGELLSYQHQIVAITSVIMILIGAEFAGAFTLRHPVLSSIILLLIFPCTLFLLTMIWWIALSNTKGIANYIRDSIEKPIQDLLGDAYNNWLGKDDQSDLIMGWETNLKKLRESLSTKRAIWASVFMVAILMLVFSIGAGSYFLLFADKATETWNAVPLPSAAISVIRWGLIIIPVALVIISFFVVLGAQRRRYRK